MIRCSAAIRALLSLPIAVLLCPGQDHAPQNDLGFTLGGIPSLARGTAQQTLDISGGTALGVNYGRRIFDFGKLAFYGEIDFRASPDRAVSSNIGTTTRDFATLFITPGVRIKFSPRSKISPYVVAGAGYADFEQSTTQIDGNPNAAPRQIGRGVFDFGAGVDVRVWRWLAARGEARDFYSGAPAYNSAAISGWQHNVAVSGGFVLRWH